MGRSCQHDTAYSCSRNAVPKPTRRRIKGDETAFLPLIFCIFHGVGGRVDDSAVFADGIINIDEDQPTYAEQDTIGPDGSGKQVGVYYASDAEKDDKVAGEEHPTEDSPASDFP